MAQLSSLRDRWCKHRRNLEFLFHEGASPRVSPGEFFIIAAVEMMMATLDEVLAKVAEERAIEQSLSTLLDGYNDALKALTDQVAELQKELVAAGQDTTKIDAIMASLDDNESILNAARAKVVPAVLTPGDGGDGAAPIAEDPAAGTDTVASGDASDTVAGGNGSDTLVDGNAEDTLTGGQSADTVTGDDTTSDTVAGGNADDTLAGGTGDDSIG